MAEITISDEVKLGIMCLKIIFISLKPITLAATTNFLSLYCFTCPLTSLATSTHIVKPTAKNTCHTPFPRARDIAITNNKVGIDQTILTIHIIIVSIIPE